MNHFHYLSPIDYVELYALLREPGGKILAGGTDLIPQMRNGIVRPARVIDISRVRELKCIDASSNAVLLGACVTHAELLSHSALRSLAGLLLEAVSKIGSAQTRHRGTIGGNIGNASPAGDTLPPLLVLDAWVTLACQSGKRSMPLRTFLLGPRRTAIRPDEAILNVSFDPLPQTWGSVFVKLGARQGMAISVASCAVALSLEGDGRIGSARVAFGALAPTALRCERIEAALVGRFPDDISRQLSGVVAAELAPISDLRSTAGYRLHAADILLARAIRLAASDATRRFNQ